MSRASQPALLLVPLPSSSESNTSVVLGNTSTHSETHPPAVELSCLSKNRERPLLLNHQVGIQCALLLRHIPGCSVCSVDLWSAGSDFQQGLLEGVVILWVLFFSIVWRQVCRWLIVYDFRKAVILDTLEGEREKKKAGRKAANNWKKKKKLGQA